MKKNIKTIFALFMVLSLSSCLKDNELIGPDADGAVSNIIEFKNIAAPSSSVTSTYPLYVRSFDIEPKIDLNIPVQIAGLYNPSGDIKVVVEIDNSLLEVYNEENETSYVPLQAANYEASSFEVTIPKGQKAADFVLHLFTDKFDFDESYALGLRIKSASEGTVSGNFGAIVVAIGAKNAVDGIYTVTGSASDNASVNTGQYPKQSIALETYGPNSVLYYDDYYGVYGTIFLTATGGATYYSNFCPIFDYEDDGTITGVRNAYGNASQNASGRDGRLNPAGVNKITFAADGSVQKIEVSYYMTQAGNPRLTFNEVFTFKSAR